MKRRVTALLLGLIGIAAFIFLWWPRVAFDTETARLVVLPSEGPLGVGISVTPDLIAMAQQAPFRLVILGLFVSAQMLAALTTLYAFNLWKGTNATK